MNYIQHYFANVITCTLKVTSSVSICHDAARTCLLLWAMALCVLSLADGDPKVQEYCQNEQFKVTCADDEVIVIRNATYGRMRLSRCVKRDYGYTGCSADALPHADSICSGRRSCTLNVPSSELDSLQPCPEDFKNFLEISYDCVKVISTRSKCTGSDYMLTSHQGTLASIVTSETGCGSSTSPLLIQLPVGRRIAVTLMDFQYSVASHNDVRTVGAVKDVAYAILKEPETGQTVTVYSEQRRERQVYISETNKLSIILLATTAYQSQQNRYFLLNYATFGCEDPPVPENGWMERKDDTVTMICNGASEKYQLTCINSKWDGTWVNCTQEVRISSLVSSVSETVMSLDLALVIVVSIAFIIACVILCLGLVFIKGRRSRPTGYEMPTVSKISLPPGYLSSSYLYQQAPNVLDIYQHKEPYETYHSSSGSNDYASIGENGLMGGDNAVVACRDNSMNADVGNVRPPVLQRQLSDISAAPRLVFPPPPPLEPLLTSSFKRNDRRSSTSRSGRTAMMTDTLPLTRQYFIVDPPGTVAHVARHDPYAAV